MVKAIDEGLRAPPPMTCLQWVNTNGYVSVGASPGPYDINRLPYAREVFEAVDDPTVRRMTIMKGTQVGATETYIQILGYFIDRNPRLTMLVFPTATTVQQMNKLRIGPALRGMPAIANIEMTEEREPYQRKGGSALVTKIGAMTILWRGAGSDSQTDSWPAGLVIIDELDRCKAGTAYKALERNKTYVDGLGITLGNPGFAGEGIDAEYALSDQRKYHLPCPACGVFHVRTFSRVRWRGVQRDGTVGPDSRDINVDPEQAAATAVYKCAACHALIPPSENMAQLRRGVWVPKSWELVVNADGSAYAERPPDVAPKSHRGWHWPELISPLIPSPYAPAAKDFVALKGIITPEFASHKEGRAWRAKATGKVNLEPLLSRVAPGHRLGFVPGEAVALVAGIDRQDRSLYAHVTAIGAKMRRVWTVWYESLEAPLGHGLNVLDGLLSRVWQRTDGRLMRISQAVIDSGDGDHQREVYEYAGSRPSVWALKAFGKDRSSKYMKTAHELVTLDPRSLGFAPRHPVKLLKINSHAWKMWTHRAIGLALPHDGFVATADDDAEVVKEDMARAASEAMEWVFPADADENYLRHIASEECVLTENRKRGGRTSSGSLVPSYEWKLRDGFPENHYFDAAVYSIATAHACGGAHLESSIGVEVKRETASLEKNHEEQEENLQVQRPSLLSGMRRSSLL